MAQQKRLSMEAIINSFLLVFMSEMGDKTQLLALVLTLRFKKPWPIMGGILLATILNHALASYAGSWVAQFFGAETLKWILSGTFILFGLWILIPDKDEELKEQNSWGPFLTTLVAFFFAEMGDKTQLATVALGAKYSVLTNTEIYFSGATAVTIGTTLGMLGADGLAVAFGQKFTEKIPMKWIHRFASGLFIMFGLAILFVKT